MKCDQCREFISHTDPFRCDTQIVVDVARHVGECSDCELFANSFASSMPALELAMCEVVAEDAVTADPTLPTLFRCR